MTARLVAVDDSDYRLPDPVRQALATDLGRPATELGEAVAAARGFVADTDFATLEEALAATAAGGVLEIRTVHARDATFTIDKPVTLRFVNGATISTSVASIRAITVTANGVTVDSPRLTGTGSATSGSGMGLYADGVTGLRILNAHIEGWSQYGICLSRVSDFEIKDTLVRDVAYAGVMLLSCVRGFIFRTEVDGVTQPGNLPQSYGFAATKDATQPLTTHPHSMDITFKSCVARNVTKWEGFDTHAGIRIRWEDCQAINCYHGIAVVGMEDKTTTPGTPGWAPVDFVISGCSADSTVTDGSRGSGLSIAGQSLGAGNPHAFATGKVIGMKIIGHGDVTNGNQGGTYIHTTRGLVLDGLTAEACSPHGVVLAHTNYEFQIDNIEVIDPWKGGGGDAPVGLAFRSSHNQGFVGKARIWRGSKTADQVLGYGIRNWINTADTSITYGMVGVTGAVTAPLLNPGNRMGQRLEGSIGFFGATPTLKPTVSGSRTDGTALTSLLSALASLGLITNSTTT